MFVFNYIFKKCETAAVQQKDDTNDRQLCNILQQFICVFDCSENIRTVSESLSLLTVELLLAVV